MRKCRALDPIALFLTAILLALAAVPAAVAQDQPGAAASPIAVPNPASDLWRAVRQRDDMAGIGNTQVSGVQTGVLIQKSGEDWRNYRTEDFVGVAALFLAAMAAIVLLFYFIRGEIPIEEGRSGRRIRRFPDFDRVLHWFTASLFVFLAITGLTLLFGRYVGLPVFGPEAFSVIASASKEGHNLIGPLFLLAVLMMLVRWGLRNLPGRGDLMWLLKGGGIIGKGHVSAGFFNAGEKIWFWGVVTLGLVLSVTGLVLIFPVFGQGREIMQLMLVIHGIAAILFIGGSFGHIYIGTIGTQGSLESMTTGFVDENWAKLHHNRWYEEVKQQLGEHEPIDADAPATVAETAGRLSPATDHSG
jgi:formate dehydrogenase subunit gamma